MSDKEKGRKSTRANTSLGSILEEECKCKKYCVCALKSRNKDESHKSSSGSKGSQSHSSSKRSKESSQQSEETGRIRKSETISESQQDMYNAVDSEGKVISSISSQESAMKTSSQALDLTSSQEIHLTSSQVLAKMQKDSKGSFVTFSPSSSDESAPTLRSSFWESSYSIHKDLLKAKQFIQKGYPVTLYDHLSEVVQRVVANRIERSVDFIESISKDVKDQRFLQGDNLNDLYKNPINFCEIRRLNSMYLSLKESPELITNEEIKSSLEMSERISEVTGAMSVEANEPDPVQIPNFIESNNYFRQAGFGLPDWEVFDLTVSVRRLVKKMKNVFSKIRFFGKIFGTYKQYYVLETEFTLEEIERCKKIQFEKEQALLAGEKSDLVVTSSSEKLGEQVESEELSEADKLFGVSHDELVRRVTEKSERMRQESLKASSGSQSKSKGSASLSGDTRSSGTRPSGQSGSVKTGSASIKGSNESGLGTQGSRRSEEEGELEEEEEGEEDEEQEFIDWEAIARENEEMVRELIFEMIRGIMQCIAIDIVKVIESELPCLPAEPVNTWTPPKDVPLEEIGEGLNRTVFWVCNNLEDEWICLPDVTPKHIDIARKITLGFTGNLDTDVMSYPPFHGKEREYLRAQLARINSSTSVSPLGYYKKGVEGGGDDDDGDVGVSKYYEEGEDYDENYDYEDDGIDIKRNPHYQTRSLTQLAQEPLFHWVHHRKEIKKDGRITWWEEDEEPDIEEEDNEMEYDGTETEHTVITNQSSSRMPRPLFKPLSREKQWMMGGARVAWSVTRQQSYFGGPHIVALRSLRWPGAVAYATVDGKTDHIYIGWGLKFFPRGYIPVGLPPFMEEYPVGDDITEVADPSVTDEEDQLEEWEPRLRPRKSSAEFCTELLNMLEEGEQEGTSEEGEEDESRSTFEEAEVLTSCEKLKNTLDKLAEQADNASGQASKVDSEEYLGRKTFNV